MQGRVYLLSLTNAGTPLWLVSFLSIRLHVASMDDSKFITLLLYKYIISSFANFEVTPAASYQFTHFTSLTLAWKSDPWCPLSHHCYWYSVNGRGFFFCYCYFALEKCSFTSFQSGYQQRRVERVTWGLFVLGVVVMIFVYLFVFFILWRGFRHTKTAPNINNRPDANSVFSSGARKATTSFLSLFFLFSFSSPHLPIWWFLIT